MSPTSLDPSLPPLLAWSDADAAFNRPLRVLVVDADATAGTAAAALLQEAGYDGERAWWSQPP